MPGRESEVVERRRRLLIERFGVAAVFPEVPGDPARRLDADLVRLHASLFAIAATVSRRSLRALARHHGIAPPPGAPDEERIYGRVTALAGADGGSERPLLLAYVGAIEKPPAPDLISLLDPVKPRAEEPDAAMWLPLAAIRLGEISIANIDSSRYDWPLVRYSIVDGRLTSYPI